MSEMKFFDRQSKVNTGGLNNFWEYQAAVREIELYELQINSNEPPSRDQMKEYADLVERAGNFETDKGITRK